MCVSFCQLYKYQYLSIFLNIQFPYNINIFLYIVWFYIILSVKFLNSNNNTVLIFWGGTWYLSLYLFPKNQSSSCLVFFSLGLHQPQAFFYLLLFWLCFCISLGVCVCEFDHSHTTLFYLLGLFILGPSPIIHLSFVKCS